MQCKVDISSQIFLSLFAKQFFPPERYLSVSFQSWRWSYYLSGIPGVLIGALILTTVREPGRGAKSEKADSSGEREELLNSASNIEGKKYETLAKLKKVIMNSFNLSLIILYIAGSIRNSCKS